MVLNYTSTNGSIYYSILVHVPKTQVILELVSSKAPSTTTKKSFMRGSAKLAAAANAITAPPSSESRFHFSEEVASSLEATSAATPLLTPLHISKAVADVAEITAFYKDVMGISPVNTQSLPDKWQGCVLPALYKGHCSCENRATAELNRWRAQYRLVPGPPERCARQVYGQLVQDLLANLGRQPPLPG
jgi:hypothetical protein